MSVELPKPVAHILSNGVLTHVDLNEDDALFTESDLLAYAAKCVEADLAKHAALVEAADGLMEAIINLRQAYVAMRDHYRCAGIPMGFVDGPIAAYEDARK